MSYLRIVIQTIFVVFIIFRQNDVHHFPKQTLIFADILFLGWFPFPRQWIINYIDDPPPSHPLRTLDKIQLQQIGSDHLKAKLFSFPRTAQVAQRRCHYKGAYLSCPRITAILEEAERLQGGKHDKDNRIIRECRCVVHSYRTCHFL